MSDLGDIKDRIGSAVGKLFASLDSRHRGNTNLLDLLDTVEHKFNERTSELALCTTRIDALSEANDHLKSLIDRLIGVIDGCINSDADGTMRRATEIVEDFLRLRGSDPGGASGETGHVASAPAAATVVPIEQAFSRAGPTPFRDVSADELNAEEQLEPAPDDPALPLLVREAHVLALVTGDADDLGDDADTIMAVDAPEAAMVVDTGFGDESGIVDLDDLDDLDVVADIAIPQPEPEPQPAPVGGAGRTNADIKEMMARLEEAAARAQARLDEEAKRGIRPEAGKPAPRKRGRAA